MKSRKPDTPLIFKHCSLPLHVTIRPCVKNDLPHLEWFGMFTSHRKIIRGTYKAQERGEALMLIAETNCLPAGQLWIDLVKKKDESAGYIWAMRIIPWLQRMGIGTALISVAEVILTKRGYRWIELGVEKENAEAQRFYERRGYLMVGTEQGEFEFTTPGGVLKRMQIDHWVLRKNLRQADSDVAIAPATLETA
jgi:ribosomal protein S18 acetylase RimI-like enzyme